MCFFQSISKFFLLKLFKLRFLKPKILSFDVISRFVPRFFLSRVFSNFRLKKGDYIQLGTSGKVYAVTNDQTSLTGVIGVHRPLLDATANYNLVIGTNVVWDVICVQWPNYTIFGYDQVSWSGPFIFVEAI